jgi:hypothetical protein
MTEQTIDGDQVLAQLEEAEALIGVLRGRAAYLNKQLRVATRTAEQLQATIDALDEVQPSEDADGD